MQGIHRIMIGIGFVLVVIALLLVISFSIPKGKDWDNPDV